MDKIITHSRRTLIAVVGGLVVLLGLVMVPYPGPGWLVVFGGLAILSTEFTWARNLLNRAKGYYRRYEQWVKVQPAILRVLIWTATALVVVTTIWLLNAFGLVNNWLNLGLDWLNSPLF